MAEDSRNNLESHGVEDEADPRSSPVASFPLFVSSLASQALIHLGAMGNPLTGKTEKSLDQAKYMIDLLQLLKDKTAGNLDKDEQNLLNGCLYDLRMKYVEACRPT